MSLVEACSLCEGLEYLESEPDKDNRALERFGRWLIQFSPIVAPQPPDAIAIDVTGTEAIFGSQVKLLATVARAIAKLDIRATVATAPTLGGAWAMAYSLEQGGCVVEPGELRTALEPLTLASLRIEEPARQTLAHLGVHTVGQLLQIPRSTLPSRFGEALLQRVDQALGVLPEPLVGLAHIEPIVESLEFEGKVESQETLDYAIGQLMDRVLPVLHRRGCGARQVHVDFLRDKLLPVRKTVSLAQPSRHRRLLMNLLRCSLETLQTNEGFIGLRLEIIGSEKVVESQMTLFEQQEQIGQAELGHLVERLLVRLGEPAVQGGVLVESHAPERAAKRVPVAEVIHRRPKPRPATKKKPKRKPWFRTSATSKDEPGEGFRQQHASRKDAAEPSPNPLPEYRERAQSAEGQMGDSSRSRSPLTLVQYAGRGQGEGLRQQHEHREDGAERSTFLRYTGDAVTSHMRLNSDLSRVGFSPPSDPVPVPMRIAGDYETALLSPPALASETSIDADDREAQPLRLFDMPIEVRCIVTPSTDEVGQPATIIIDGVVHRVIHVVGPQRVTGLWWEGRNKTRDYYDAELPGGRRVWIFQVQETRRWFWQGEY